MTMIHNDQRAVGAIALAGFLGTSGLGGINIAMPLIAGDFNAPLSRVSWVVSSYLLILAGFCIITGRIADRRGLKRTFLEGTLIFMAASVLCFCACDLPVLIAARILQGAGAAMFIATGPALIAVIIPGQKRGTGLSWFNAACLCGTIAGIGIGGIVSDTFGWRYLFLLMVLPGLAVFILGKQGIPDIPVPQVAAPFDSRGSLLFFSAMTTLLAGLSMDYQPSVQDMTPVFLYAVSLLLWAAFILHAHRTPSPVLDLSLFTDRQFSYAVLSRTVMDITFGGLTFLLPFILSLALHISVATTGLILMAAAGLSLLAAPAAGHLADRYGSRPVCIAGVTLTLCILAGFSLLSKQYMVLIVPLAILFRMSSVACAAPSAKLILDHCPPGRAGAASGIMQTGRYAAYTIGIAVFIFVFEGAVYSAGLPCNGLPIIPRLTPELLRTAYLAIFGSALLVTLPALFFSILARDREKSGTDDAMQADGESCRHGF